MEEKNFEDQILLKILYYFNYCIDFNKVDLGKIKDIFIQFCDDNGLNSDDLINQLKPKLKETLLFWEYKERRKKIIKEVYAILKKHISDLQIWNSIFEEYSLNILKGLIGLYFALEEFGFSSSQDYYPIMINYVDDQWRIYLNDSIIIISNKRTIGNVDFYDSYKNYLINEKNIFLTLLGLEIRNKFRKSSGFIGKELNEISQIAFFYHNKKIKDKEFFEFLKQIWIDQTSSVFYDREFRLLKAIDEYKNLNNIDNQVENFESELNNQEMHQKDLVCLNKFYNVLTYYPQPDDQFSFGDIFKSRIDKEEIFFLCITPLCDCANPNKIKNQYSFVRHENIIESYKKSLEGAEGKHISFINRNRRIICIDWGECKPFTLYVKNPKIINPSKINYLNKYIEFEFICRIKEKYVQRIVNHAYQYPLRVGVSFAQIQKEE